MKKEKEDWWNIISEEERESIEKGIRDANAGKLTPHSEVRKRYKNSYKAYDLAFKFLNKFV